MIDNSANLGTTYASYQPTLDSMDLGTSAPGMFPFMNASSLPDFESRVGFSLTIRLQRNTMHIVTCVTYLAEAPRLPRH